MSCCGFAGLLALSALVEFVGFAICFLPTKVALVEQSTWSLGCFDETVYLGIIDRLAGAGVLVQDPKQSVSAFLDSARTLT